MLEGLQHVPETIANTYRYSVFCPKFWHVEIYNNFQFAAFKTKKTTEKLSGKIEGGFAKYHFFLSTLQLTREIAGYTQH